MRLKKIDYKISQFDGNRQVTGYAIDLPPPLQNFRICLRRKNNKAWTCDHYDSGYFVDYAGATLTAAKKRIPILLELYATSGRLTKSLRQAGFAELAETIDRDIQAFQKEKGL